MRENLVSLFLCVVTAAAMSCTYPSPAPIRIAEGPPARIEWLLGAGAPLNAVHLTEPGVGAAVGESGAILITSDAGVTWKAVESGTDKSLRGVAFSDVLNGVAVGANGTLLRTEDAGRTWMSIGTGSTAELRGVAFDGPAVAIIVGEGGVMLRTEDAGRTWQPVASGTTSTLRGVRFVSPSVAAAAGDDGTLLRSTDGGTSWTLVDSGTSAALRALHFIDATTGVAVGGDDRRWRSERIVLRTVDSGATWTQIDAPNGTRLYGVAAAGDGSIVAVGDGGASIRSADQGLTWQGAAPVKKSSKPNTPDARWDTSNSFAGVSSVGSSLVAVTYGGRIHRSTDGGAAWSPVQQTPDMDVASFPNSPVAQAGDGAMVIGSGNFIFRSTSDEVYEKSESAGDQIVFSIRFLDANVGVSVGVAGRIQRTVDRGKTWATVESGTKRNLRGVAFADDKHGIAVAGPAGTGPGMVRSEDGGLSWHPQECVNGTKICDSTIPLIAVAMLPSQIGMAVGGGGVVIKTADGGRTWTKLEHGRTTALLWGISLIDDNTAVVVGTQGIILHTRDGGETWERRDSGTPLFLSSVAFGDASRGVIVGQAGTILTTEDGGLTWRRESPRTMRDFSTVIFDADGRAVITGSPGFVLRYTWPTNEGVSNE